MAYINKEYYKDVFKGTNIPETEFDRLAEIASDITYDVCNTKPDKYDCKDEYFLKAVAYEVEFLHEQGGIDAVVGFSDADTSYSSEHLGNYSYTGNNKDKNGVKFINGVPVSSMSIMLLRRLGLMCRCVYNEKENKDVKK